MVCSEFASCEIRSVERLVDGLSSSKLRTVMGISVSENGSGLWPVWSPFVGLTVPSRPSLAWNSGGGGLSFAGQRVQAARLRSAPRWGSAAATAEVLQRALDPPDSLRLAWPGVRREAWARRDHVPYLHTEAFIAPGLMIIALIRSFITARMEMSGYAFAC